MRTVRGVEGERYRLLKRSAESTLVRDLETGERRHVPNDRLTEPTGLDSLRAAAAWAPEALREQLPDPPDDRALGLLVALETGPLRVRTVLDATELCESDLLGLAGELRSAGLVAATTVDGEPGYELTPAARDVLSC